MSRTAKITIRNLTGYALSYVGENVKHGKLKTAAPVRIEVNGTGSFEVSNRTAAAIGPEGTVTYKFTVIAKEVPVDVYLVFYWNHPFARPESVYSVGSIPVGLSSFDLLPAQPTGHDQLVTLSVRAHDLLNAYDIGNWMRHVDGGKSLAALTIPGTHNSGALSGGVAVECQKMGIRDQLLKGVRYLDIRCRLKSGHLRIFHGPHEMDLSFADVQDACLKFLDEHPDEAILMCVNKEGGDDIAHAFAEAIKSHLDKWHLKDEIPRLDAVRGKIVLLRRFTGGEPTGINLEGWPDDAAGWARQDEVYVQDCYKVYDTTESLDGKWGKIAETCTLAAQGEMDAMYINFTSGAVGITPVMLATGNGIILEVPGMNERLERHVIAADKQRFGIVVMDFPEYPNEHLIPYLIGLNRFA